MVLFEGSMFCSLYIDIPVILKTSIEKASVAFISDTVKALSVGLGCTENKLFVCSVVLRAASFLKRYFIVSPNHLSWPSRNRTLLCLEKLC